MSLRDLISEETILESVQLNIHAHSGVITVHDRECYVPEATEVAALISGVQHRKLDIVRRFMEASIETSAKTCN